MCVSRYLWKGILTADCPGPCPSLVCRQVGCEQSRSACHCPHARTPTLRTKVLLRGGFYTALGKGHSLPCNLFLLGDKGTFGLKRHGRVRITFVIDFAAFSFSERLNLFQRQEGSLYNPWSTWPIMHLQIYCARHFRFLSTLKTDT